MRTLLLGAILYLLGVAIILFFRPKLMFHADGRWKEFGTVSPDHTVFPFWLFCILWAAAAYLISLLFTDEFSGPILKPIEPPDDLLMPLPPRTRTRPRAQEIEDGGNMKPGYYVLDTKELRKSGIPKYIYMGEEGPEGLVAGRTDVA